MESAVGREVTGAEGVLGTCPVTTVKVGAVDAKILKVIILRGNVPAGILRLNLF
jgi:hypothetical protein